MVALEELLARLGGVPRENGSAALHQAGEFLHSVLEASGLEVTPRAAWRVGVDAVVDACRVGAAADGRAVGRVIVGDQPESAAGQRPQKPQNPGGRADHRPRDRSR